MIGTRYSERPLPREPYRPGLGPHPVRDRPWVVKRSADWLYGVDLFNHACWWEAHEVFEDLWRAAGRDSAEGRFFQGLVHASAAYLHRARGGETRLQGEKALLRLAGFEGIFLGVDVPGFRRELEATLADPRRPPAWIVLRSQDPGFERP